VHIKYIVTLNTLLIIALAVLAGGMTCIIIASLLKDTFDPLNNLYMRCHKNTCITVFNIFLLLILSASCTRDSKCNSPDKVLESLSQQADSLYKLGRSYSEDSLNHEKALEIYAKSFDLYEKSGNRLKMAMIYKRIGFAYDYLEDYSKVKEYQKKALKIATEIDNKKQAAIILNFLGIAYTITGNLDTALMYYSKGIELSEITGDTLEIIEIYQNMGISYRDAGEYENAIESFIIALKYCETTNYTTGIFDINLNIAQLYEESGEIDKALTYCNNAAVFIILINNYYKQASYYQTFGELYFAQNNYSEAFKFFKKTLEISQKNNYKRGAAAAYSNLSLVALREHNFDEAEKYANLSIELETEIENAYGIIVSLVNIAEVLYAQKFYDKALIQLHKAKDLCNEKGIYDQLPNIYFHFYQVYKLYGKQKLALKFYEDYNILKDSLSGIGVKEKIAALEIKYQTEKKQQQIELLNEENRTKEQKLKARNWLLVSLILLVIVIISIANFFRQRASHRLNQMELDIQKYILKIRDLNSVGNNEPEITSNEFSIKYDLTERETEVLHLITEGMPNVDIGKNIFVSTNTVKYHIKNIYLKLDVKNRVEALNKIKQ